MEDKLNWVEPEINNIGNAVEITEGGGGGDPKFFGTGDQFAVNDLTT